MKKWLVLQVALVSLCFMTTSALAVNFDITPFENSENYIIELDDMDDTGSISLVEGGFIVGKPSEGEDDEGLMAGQIDISMYGAAPSIRLLLAYVGYDLIHLDTVILKPDDTRYTFLRFTRQAQTAGERIIEGAAITMSDESIKMLEEIVDKKITSVRCRFDGERSVDFDLTFDIEKLDMLLKDYKASGALDNDFTLARILSPCTIE